MKKIILCLIIIFPQLLLSQWFIVNHISNYQFYSVYFTSNTVGCVGGNQNGVIFKTTDSGSNFSSTPTGTNIWFLDIYFVNTQTGYAAGQDGYIVKTTNGGLNWNVQYQGLNFIHSIRFLDLNTGYAAGFTHVYKTTNGGNSWGLASEPYTNYLLGTSFVNTSTGFICGNGGLIARTTNGGSNWQAILNGGSDQFEEIVMTNSSTGYTVGRFGKILKTTNGGSNWDQQISSTSEWLLDLYMINSNSGWACGMNGKIVYTSNGGTNWHSQYVPTVSTIRQLHFLTPDTGYAVTDNGMILKTYTAGNIIGINPRGSQVPNDFAISQNYPNPFNPSTSIKFSIPRSSYVNLKIYDNIGKEISTLVDQDVGAGNYEVNFNADEFTSGVYFYRITADDFTETRKMILIK
jgi:photosystem II stability/assembly factor-like uncharacterized protein